MTYDYECQSCGTYFKLVRKIANRDDPCSCPECNGDGKKVILSAPMISLDPFCGHFHQASVNWEKRRDKIIAKERHNAKEHGESGLNPR